MARDLGEGRLQSRFDVRFARGEVRSLAEVMNGMAERIERQLKDQRELLAAVSHELRTPLARVRLLLELGRGGDASVLDQLEREVLEMDALVGELLASARLDFTAMARVPLDAGDLGARALERAALPPALLEVESGPGVAGGRSDPAPARALQPPGERPGPRRRRDPASGWTRRTGWCASRWRTRGPGCPRAESAPFIPSSGERRATGSGSASRWCGASPRRTAGSPSPRTAAGVARGWASPCARRPSADGQASSNIARMTRHTIRSSVRFRLPR